MSDKRDIKFKNISKYHYRELKNFCFQYSEWKKKLAELNGDIKAYQVKDFSKTNKKNDPIGELVCKKDLLLRNCKLIEQSAIEADAYDYQAIIKNVTEEIPYEYLNIYCCRSKFYKMRKKFFEILAEKKSRQE